MSDNISTQVLVLGGGPGGYPAAFKAADLGLDVTLVDMEKNPGGVCLYRGCIPSKALLHAAKVLNEARDAKELGINFGEPTINLDQLRNFKDKVVTQLTGGVGLLSKQRKVRFIQGRGEFSDAHTLSVALVDGGTTTINFEYAIIATGSRPTVIPAFDIGSERIMDSTSALTLPEIPETLLVVGGGYIGLELGTVYAALGSKVTVVEMLPRILSTGDEDLVIVLARQLNTRFEKIMVSTQVLGMEEIPEGIRVRFRDPQGDPFEETFSRVLVSVGRKPNSAGLGLDKIGVAVDGKGFITVDKQRRTNIAHIFAVGDVAGEPMLAHKATREGHVAAEAISGKPTEFDVLAIPAVVFTDPEVAWCGMTEMEAEARKRPVRVAHFPWGASGRATTLGRSDGMTKLVIDSVDDRVLGVGIVGTNAGELISEGVLAVEMGATAADLELTIHPHPTLSETVMESAEGVHGQSTHIYKRK
ncbi:MAG: dihydrolipoyl dehydrogenase [Caldilineae bacterium]|nr:dihydrolipoyl dehydrogenase [Anaerolineae bacterium]MCB0205998.1 dihydrolipoyl dehydrogenase [Anaerolineae bacterium]MCB0252177.1 dihydrolipoyl dehydrogenase [Anaerolineae bacterium]MCB9153486.1 dihydrolipoyl dehydrogenase [Caldilineae bacterium]